MRWHLRIALAALVLAAASHGPARAAPCFSGLTVPEVVRWGTIGYSCDLGLATYTFFDNLVEWQTTSIHFAAPRSTAMGLYTPFGQTTAIWAPNEVHRVTFQGFTNPDGSSFIPTYGSWGMFTFYVSPNKLNYILEDDPVPFISYSGPPLSDEGVIEGRAYGGATSWGSISFDYVPDLVCKSDASSDRDCTALQIVTAISADFTIVPRGWVRQYDLPTSVPEPGPLALLLSGLAALLICRAARPG